MIAVEGAVAQGIISLFDALNEIIPIEWSDVVTNLKSQLSSGQCDEVTLSMMLCLLKSFKDEREKVIEEDKSDEPNQKLSKKDENNKIAQLIDKLTILTVSQGGGLYNEIRRNIW